MTAQTRAARIDGDQPVSHATTMADLIDRLVAAPDLAPNRRRDLVSAIRRFCALVDRDPRSVPADAPAVRAAIARIKPPRHGIGPKTWSNLKANLLAAVRYGATIAAPARAPISEHWQGLWKLLPGKRLCNGLSRFIHYCSARAIAPRDVDDAVMAHFHAHLAAETLVPDPDDLHRRTCRLWNEAGAIVPGWPCTVVDVPSHRRPRRRLDLSAFPASFATEIEAYLASRANPDPFDLGTSLRPLKPGTIRLRREQLRLAAGALVVRGRQPEAIDGLAALVEVEAFKDILRQLLDDHAKQANAWTEGVAKTLIAVAREWVKLSAPALADLRRLADRLPKRAVGMTAKNRETVRPFDDDGILAGFLDLPRRLFEEACRVEPPTIRAAVKAQVGLAIEILLACPIRSENLIELRIGEHLLRPAGARGAVYLCLEPAEVKNEERIDFELPDHLVVMLDEYLRRFQPLLGGADCPHLFPASGGVRKAQSTLAQQIHETITKRLGLSVTPHQFRHIAAKLHLDAAPGAIEQLRLLLGHKTLKTTIAYYAEFDTRRAGVQHDRIIQGRREALALDARRRRRPVNRKVP